MATKEEQWISPEGVSGLVSVVVPTRNRSRLLEETLNSLLSQTYRSVQLIIVDDGSEDETTDYVTGLLEEPPEGFEILYRRQEHAGGPAARNLGAKLSTGEFIVFMDDDDLPTANFLDSRLQALRSDSKANLAYGLWQVFINDDDKYQLLAVKGEYPENVDSAWYAFLDDWALLLQGCVLRRELVSKAGPWQTDLHKSQDLDYKARILSQENCHPVFTAGSPMFYRLHDESISGALSPAKLDSHVAVIDHIEELCVQRSDYKESKLRVADFLWAQSFWLYGAGEFARAHRQLERAKRHDPQICRRKGFLAAAFDIVGLDTAIGPGYHFISRCKRAIGLSKRKVLATTDRLPDDVIG